MPWLLSISILIGVLASAEDLWRRQISNPISVTAFVLGLGAHTALGGLRGAGDSLAGTVVGFLVFFIFFLLGGMGGGDIKLMAGFGAVLGARGILTAALLTAILGALLALAYLAVRRLRGPSRNHAAQAEAIPYAPAISLGAWLSFAAG